MTETSISAYDNFIIQSAERYLQTVVLIDDRIYESKSGSVTSHLSKPPETLRKPALKSVTTASDKSDKELEKPEITEKPDEISFHDVQNSFAKKRIICSLYQPKSTAAFSELSDVYKLCSAADVVVIDWSLYGDSGKNATDLIGTLVEHSMRDIPNQLRLILIYTTEPDLKAVANDTYEALVERLGERFVEVEEESDKLILTTDNTRVVILGNRINTVQPQYSDFFVLEKDLAQRTIYEFSQLASGLLQGIVLNGVANLRKNNRRILARFHKDLDIAFLTHRALLLPDEAFGHIIPLLTDEMRAVLEDTLGESPLGKTAAVKEILNDWCDKHWNANINADLEIGDGINGLEFVKDVFCNGPAINKDDYMGGQIPGLIKEREDEPPKWNDKKYTKLVEYLSGDCTVEHYHEKLGSLMSQRVRYDSAQRTLHLGVIVRELADKKRFLLCLQPVCDSVRMGGKDQSFVFCVLKIPKDGKGCTHFVIGSDGNVIQLQYKPKVSSIFVTIFKGRNDGVYVNINEEDRFIFKNTHKIEYEWIAELKTEHAQRAAEEFGRELSRVGLTESEWLRIRAKK